MRPPLLKLPAWHRRWLYAAFTLLLMTGLPWLALHYGRDVDSLPPPAEAWLMRLHGLGSMVMLLALGMIAGSHVLAGWRLTAQPGRSAQRRSGLWLSGSLLASVLSAYALYYLVPEDWHPGTGWLHSGLALLALPLWAWHRPGRARQR